MQGGQGEFGQGRAVRDQDTLTCTDGTGEPAAAARSGRARLLSHLTTLPVPLMSPSPEPDDLSRPPEPPLGELISSQADADRAEISIPMGRYTLQHKVGEGGMGIVYEAQQHDLQRRVAVK